MAFYKKPFGKYAATARAASSQKRGGYSEGGSAANYRVKSPVKTFRDLDVYTTTTLLSSEITRLKIPEQLELKAEHEILKTIVKQVPRLIAESHGDKFTNGRLAAAKMEQALRYVTDAVAKIDFLIACLSDEEKNLRTSLLHLIQKYQMQRRKIFNLKRAWDRVFLPPPGVPAGSSPYSNSTDNNANNKNNQPPGGKKS